MVNYPNCQLIDVDQRSPEWFKCRAGHLTASQFGDWLTKTGKTANDARLTAASRCLAEFAGCPDPRPYETDDMKRGVEMEEPARQLFQKATGLIVDQIGFAKFNHGLCGCSPDGLILDEGSGLEIKIPRASKLIQYIEKGELPPEYVPQVHGSMAITGARKWHFFAWHPGFPYFHIVAEWNAYTDSILEGLKSYSNYIRDLSNRMQAIQKDQSK